MGRHFISFVRSFIYLFVYCPGPEEEEEEEEEGEEEEEEEAGEKGGVLSSGTANTIHYTQPPIAKE